MPLIIALIIRQIIQAAVTIGILTIAEKVILPLVNMAISKVIQIFGVTEEDANTFVANSILVYAEEIGILAISLRTKLPVKVSERLGFTSKGFNMRKLSPAGEAKLPKVGKISTVAGKEAKMPDEIAVEIAMAKNPLINVASALSAIKWLGALGVGNQVYSNIINTIDFAAWPTSAYQDTFQGIFAKVGLNPDERATTSAVLSEDMWKRIVGEYKIIGVTEINDPYKSQKVTFNVQNLKDLVDKIAAEQILGGTTPTLKNMIAATQAFMILPKGANMYAVGQLKQFTQTGATQTPAGTTVSAPQTASATYTAPQVPQVRVFSGVVSQGVIGSTAVFTPRQDDLIENAEELSQASHNNLAPFIASLGSRLSYEIKVVPSVKSASGWTQRGTAQRVISGYNKDGSPKYRTVVNKFATMDIFVKTDKGTQSKITTIVLGPVDSVRFQGASVNLGQVAVDVKQNITAPASVATPTATPAMVPIVPIPAKGVFQSKNPPFFGTLYKIVGGSRVSWSPWPELYNQTERDQLNQDPNKFAQNEQKLKDRGVITSDINIVPFIADRQPGETQPERAASSFTEFFGMAPSVATPAPVVTPVAAQATTLFEYYQAHGQSLPSVEERSKLYEQLALGQSAYYTGTAEQNTKLLAALQGARL